MEGYTSLGHWIRQRRKSLGLTQETLAERIGCAAITLRKIEADERRLSLQIAERIAVQFQLSQEEHAVFLQAVHRLVSDPSANVVLMDTAVAVPEQNRLPIGTLTFLFSDVMQATTLWTTDPQAMADAIVHYSSILHEVVIAQQGILYKIIGEQCCAVFLDAGKALSAAVAAQQQLYQIDQNVLRGFSVRMALHTGTAMVVGDDYVGSSIRRTNALLRAARGGQILLSAVTWELISDRLPPSITLRDLGGHELSELARSERIFQVCAPGLLVDFPKVRSLPSRHINLPAQTTPLLGRTNELQIIGTLLCDPTIRLLTLTGVGGTGKTRLAIQAAIDLIDSFPDAIVFVGLAPIGDAALVPSLIAQALGVIEGSAQSPLHAVIEVLRDQQVLIILDNFEHVLEAAPQVIELLMAVPDLKILVTSRARLHLSGEHEFSVPPLELPDLEALPSVAELEQYAAISLFVQRSQALVPSFLLTEANARTVAEICVCLDGLPLAIELAAARSKLLPPPALLSRLGNRLRVLTGGPRDLPARQQTLRLAIDWSYSLLSQHEQILFRQLGVFVGGCTLEAAEAVAIGSEGEQILEGLSSLIDKSLLYHKADTDGELRFTMLETIREYALERLVECGEMLVLRQRHALYYLHFVETLAPHLRTARQVDCFAQLDREHNNLRAVLAWAIEQADGETAVSLCAAIWLFWYIRGYWIEGIRWMESALTIGPHTRLRARTLLYQGLALLCNVVDNYEQARRYAEQALAMFRELGDQFGVALALNNLGIILKAQYQYIEARTLFEDSLCIQHTLPSTSGLMSLTYGNLAHIAIEEGDYTIAEQHLDAAVSIARHHAEPRVLIAAFLNLGVLRLAQGEMTTAQDVFMGALRLCRELGGHDKLAAILDGLAGVAVAQGNPMYAAELLGAAEGRRVALNQRVPAILRGRHYERIIEQVREQLDLNDFTEAWNRGRALGLEQAMLFALGEDPRPLQTN